jgi:proteic killer suppression protein
MATLEFPGFRLRPLQGKLAGHGSIWANGNWHVTFRFLDTDVEFVDYRDNHWGG